MSENDSSAIEYIKLQWQDIHHSRLQDWSYIGVIAGVLYAIVNIEKPELRIGLSLLGLLSSVLGASMAWQHYQIFTDKLVVIANLEHKLGIQYPSRTALLPVQNLIFLLFAGIASAFVGMTFYFWSEIPNYDFLRIYALAGGIASFVVVFACLIVVRAKALRAVPVRYATAYFAELDKLEKCLNYLEDKPLKLIADQYWTQPRFEEIPWDEPDWDCRHEDNRIKKPILLNQRDLFQFSLANAHSRQDWHYHKYVFEIYISSRPLSLSYRKSTLEEGKQSLEVRKGILIIPPGLPHKVTLSGTTFVFQATLAGKGLSRDKVIVEQ